MKKMKVKRYQAGLGVEGDYESSEDAKNLRLAADREAVEYEGEKIAKPLREAAAAAKAEPMKMASFGEAFKEARGRGDKTFEYMGKKYTTEMAGEKKTSAPKAESATPKSSPTTRQGKRIAEVGEALSKPAGDYKSSGSYGEAARSSRTLGDLFRGSARHARTGATYKKGGAVGSASKRADGCAQRGKTRGKMV